ncbi:MAG: ribosome biogenesis GTPase YlqF [Candidatus Gastranaerophilales bacterium]|nr:ribosome biogenesis GTPase YlqF [Candidatus Gastranaerophilales bacterium]
MTINWYPGHIAKAERELKSKLSLVDVVIEIIDARIPLSSKYLDVEKLIGAKPRLIVLNKSDLADMEQSRKWQDFLQNNANIKVLLTSANSNKDLSNIISAAIELGKDKIAALTAKGLLPRAIRAMIIGMPNVGKSSIINKLIGKKKVKTGAKAGITRQQQWVRINPRIELLDTPGIIPMKLENQDAAYKLAMVNSISESSYDNVEAAKKLTELLQEKYPNLTAAHYKLPSETPITLENIARSRNLLLLGGETDINRCASLILSDFRHGRIGRITLDTLNQ